MCELDYTVSPKFYTGKKKIEIYIDINIFDNILRVVNRKNRMNQLDVIMAFASLKLVHHTYDVLIKCLQ